MTLPIVVEAFAKWIGSCDTKEQLQVMGDVIKSFLSEEKYPNQLERIEAEIWDLEKKIKIQEDKIQSKTGKPETDSTKDY